MLPITFISDFGYRDHFAGTCRGVVASIAPGAQIIDITHGVEPQAVFSGALMLRNSISYMPTGVHLAVVDPGVGSERGAVLLATQDGRWFVGPDNGLLLPAAELVGGVTQAYDISRTPVALKPVSNTFHGRDLFAPVAAHISRGVEPSQIAEKINPANLVRFEIPTATVQGNTLFAHALYIDRFGNIQLDANRHNADSLGLVSGTHLELTVGNRSFPAIFSETFADVMAGEMLVFEDSSGALSIAVNQDSAAEWLSAHVGAAIELRAS